MPTTDELNAFFSAPLPTKPTRTQKPITSARAWGQRRRQPCERCLRPTLFLVSRVVIEGGRKHWRVVCFECNDDLTTTEGGSDGTSQVQLW